MPALGKHSVCRLVLLQLPFALVRQVVSSGSRPAQGDVVVLLLQHTRFASSPRRTARCQWPSRKQCLNACAMPRIVQVCACCFRCDAVVVVAVWRSLLQDSFCFSLLLPHLVPPLPRLAARTRAAKDFLSAFHVLFRDDYHDRDARKTMAAATEATVMMLLERGARANSLPPFSLAEQLGSLAAREPSRRLAVGPSGCSFCQNFTKEQFFRTRAFWASSRVGIVLSRVRMVVWLPVLRNSRQNSAGEQPAGAAEGGSVPSCDEVDGPCSTPSPCPVPVPLPHCFVFGDGHTLANAPDPIRV